MVTKYTAHASKRFAVVIVVIVGTRFHFRDMMSSSNAVVTVKSVERTHAAMVRDALFMRR